MFKPVQTNTADSEDDEMDLPIKKFTVSETMRIIRINLSPKKTPGYDLIIDKIFKELSITAHGIAEVIRTEF